MAVLVQKQLALHFIAASCKFACTACYKWLCFCNTPIVLKDCQHYAIQQLCIAQMSDEAAQPNATLLDCILYPMQDPYDPGTLPSSAK